jgi:hypothetical protein
MFLFIVAHIMTLLFHGLALIEIHILGEGHTWMHEAGIADEKWNIKYIGSFFWAISSMITGIVYFP